jgi:hypothetical protein
VGLRGSWLVRASALELSTFPVLGGGCDPTTGSGPVLLATVGGFDSSLLDYSCGRWEIDNSYKK